MSNLKHNKSHETEDWDLADIPQEITDALLSYEKTAALIFGTNTTIEAPNNPIATLGQSLNNTTCGITFNFIQDFHLNLWSVQNAGVRAETTVHIHSDDMQQSDMSQLHQRVTPWKSRVSFQAVRTGVGSAFRRASGSSSKLSSRRSDSSQTPHVAFSSEDVKEQSMDETASFRIFLDHAFEPDISEEPTEPAEDYTKELRPATTRLERLAHRESAKATRKTERALRKTASAGDLSQRRQEQGYRVADRKQKEFHGFMGSDFVY